MNRRYRLNMPFWQLGEAEHWYADMAAQGWHLRKRGMWLTRFDRGEPRRMLYRIDLAGNNEDLEEQKGLYGEAGWQWVTGQDNVQVFAAPEGTRELYTDCYEQAWTMRRLTVSCWRCMNLGLLMAFLLPLALWRGGVPWCSLWVQGLLALLLLLAPFYGAGMAGAFMGFAAAWRLRRRLARGVALDHHAPYQGARRMKAALAALGAACTLAGAGLLAVMEIKSHTELLPEADAPVVLMAALEGADFQRGEGDGVLTRPNTLDIKWSPFSRGYVSRETGEGGGWIIQRAQYTGKASWESQLAQEMIDQYALDKWAEFDPLEGTELTLCRVHPNGPMLEMIAGLEGDMLWISYWGDAAPETVAREAAKTLAQWRASP